MELYENGNLRITCYIILYIFFVNVLISIFNIYRELPLEKFIKHYHFL